MRGYVKNKHSRKPLAEDVVDHKARGCLVPIAAGATGLLIPAEFDWNVQLGETYEIILWREDRASQTQARSGTHNPRDDLAVI
jgi:hypothetical protein